MKRIPIKAAREVAKQYGQRCVCLVSWQADGRTHVVTYGETKQECEWAADLGNQIKAKVLKWPEELCHAKPDQRLKEKKEPHEHQWTFDVEGGPWFCRTCGMEKKNEVPSNPYSEYDCPHCGESRNGYENHHCPTPAALERRRRTEQALADELMPCGDEEVRECETCGRRMIVPGKSGTTECTRCSDGN